MPAGAHKYHAADLLRVIHFGTDPVNVCLKINPPRRRQLMKVTNICNRVMIDLRGTPSDQRCLLR